MPVEHRSNFIHLYFDVFWWGLFNGTVVVFLAVYASRLGASTAQIGMLTAAPALVNLIFTFPTNSFVRGRSSHSVVKWSALASRLAYGLLIPLPVLFSADLQVWVIILLTLALNIPGTVAGVMGNVFFAEVVPVEWRAQVVGTRNALLSVASVISSIAAGLILRSFSFNTGYQLVFALGFMGLMLSSLHLFLIRPLPRSAEEIAAATPPVPVGIRQTLRLDVLRGPFQRVLWIMLLYHFAVYLSAPIFPQYQVHVLHFSDQTISLGTSLFWVFHFIGSTQVGLLAHRMNFKKMMGIGVLLISVSTFIFVVSFHPWIYWSSQLFSGIGWSMVGGSILNYLLEAVPPEDRPAHLAWFNLAVNAAVLVCGLIASQVTALFGLLGGMLIAVGLRALAGFVILRWGEVKKPPLREALTDSQA